MPERDAVAAFDHLAEPNAMAATDAYQRAWLSDGRDFTPFWELLIRLETMPPASTPADTLDRLHAAGVSCNSTRDTGVLPKVPSLRAVTERYGKPEWAGDGWTLFRLPPSSEQRGRTATVAAG